MLNSLIRTPITRILTPVARGLLRIGVRPDMVTIVGTGGSVLGAILLYPTGHLFGGTLIIFAFVTCDLLDGTMARLSGRSSQWGALLDSTMDRVSDAAIFGGLILYYSNRNHLLAVLALLSLVFGALVPYVKARAESLGLLCDGGLAERAERMIIILVSTGIAGLGVPYIAAVGLWLVTVATIITFGQRMFQIWH